MYTEKYDLFWNQTDSFWFKFLWFESVIFDSKAGYIEISLFDAKVKAIDWDVKYYSWVSCRVDWPYTSFRPVSEILNLDSNIAFDILISFSKIFLVANQATYVFITIQYHWREFGYNPAGFESACIFMCFMGSGSMGFLLITQILQVLKGGTQYFPGNGKISLKNVIEFWTAQTGKLPEDNNQKNHFTV